MWILLESVLTPVACFGDDDDDDDDDELVNPLTSLHISTVLILAWTV